MSVVYNATKRLLPRPLLPCSVIKSRSRNIPFTGQDGSSGGEAGSVITAPPFSAVDDREGEAVGKSEEKGGRGVGDGEREEGGDGGEDSGSRSLPGRGSGSKSQRRKISCREMGELSTNLPLNSQEKDSSASGDAGSDSNRSDSLSSSTNDSDISLFPCYGMREDPTTHIRNIIRLTARVNSGKPTRELEPEVEARSEIRRSDTVPQIRR